MGISAEDVKKIIEESAVLPEVAGLADGISLKEQGMDSLDSINVFLLIEEKFNLSIPDEDLGGLQTVNDIVDYINKRLD